MRAHPGKLIVTGDGARAALMGGLDLVADAVGPTLGPCGSHVLLQRHDAGPLVTNDGVTIARSIETLRDPYTNQGVQLLREVAGITDTVVGDGTTTAVITARELLRGALAAVTRGTDCAAIGRGLTRGWATASELIAQAATPLRDTEELVALAAGAARDRRIGELVAAALDRTGSDGVVNVEDHRAYGIRLEFADGMSFPSGLLAPGLATDEARRETVFERPLILLASERITQVNQLAPVLRQAAAERTGLVVIADEVSGDALTMLVLNVRRRTIPAVAVKAPLFGEDRVAMLGDIAALTGATVCGPATGTSVASATIAQLGSAERVMVTQERTTIVSGHGDERAVASRVAGIDAELRYLESEYERDKRRLRRACLGGAVATIEVGLDTVVEQEETRLRIVDAIRSGRAAMRSGVVPGGGSVLARVADALRRDAGTGAEAVGQRLLARALEAPLRQLATNAGLDPSVAVRRVQSADPGLGLDLYCDEIIDLRAHGIIDAADVVRMSVESAVSIARTALLAEVIVAQRPLPPQPKRPYGHHHGHDHGHFGGVAPGHDHSGGAAAGHNHSDAHDRAHAEAV
ncbi:MAG TPA: chaperonin GroEL [Solirubrobacteraceae bacterium]|jgi:chaperonin GroEL